MNGAILSSPGRRALTALVALAVAGGVHAAPPEGTPVMILLRPEALARVAGANGFVVGGTFFNGGGFHWMPTGGVVDIGGLQAVDVSRDGKVIVGTALDPNRPPAGRDLEGGRNWRLLGSVRRAPAPATPC